MVYALIGLWSDWSLKKCTATRSKSGYGTHQNLNSGSRRIKGLNSSDCLVGKLGPSSTKKGSISCQSAIKIAHLYSMFKIFMEKYFIPYATSATTLARYQLTNKCEDWLWMPIMNVTQW